jgi:2-oxoglutarate dehydrogenase E2 component (dihydrolipoamide succinyltransferase)
MEIKVPEVGESVYEGLLVKWHKRNGETVRRDEPLCEIETDKITIELNAEADGILSIQAKEGVTVKIGSVIGTIAESSAELTTPVKRRRNLLCRPAPYLPPHVNWHGSTR